MTDRAPAVASGPPRELADLFTVLAARQDAAVERLTHAVARVLAEASRADTATRAAQVDSIQTNVARIVQEAVTNGSRHEVEARRVDTESLRSDLARRLDAVQSGIVDRVGQSTAADSEALRSVLSSGFTRVGDRVTEALRSELTRLETALAPPDEVADSVVSAVRDELLAAVRQVAQDTSAVLEHGFTSLRTTLAEVAHDGRSAAEGVASLGPQGLGPMRADLRTATEQLSADMASVRGAIAAAQSEADGSEERAERLRTELVVTMGALEESLRRPISSLRAPIEALWGTTEAAAAAATAQAQATAILQADLAKGLEALQTSIARSVAELAEASRTEAVARQAGFAAVQRQVDDLTAATRSIADAQTELRRVVAQLWGGDEPS